MFMKYDLIVIAILLISCGEPSKSNSDASVGSIDTTSTLRVDTINSDGNKINSQKLKLLVIQCSNGYVYSMYNHEFNPVIERDLKGNDKMEVIPFPYKKLMGVPYQGVYDKKYCKPIMERVVADYFIMTRFIGPYDGNPPGLNPLTWGYETKILNTKTMDQKISIGKSGFKKYEDIEIDIKNNIAKLVKDIEDLK